MACNVFVVEDISLFRQLWYFLRAMWRAFQPSLSTPAGFPLWGAAMLGLVAARPPWKLASPLMDGRRNHDHHVHALLSSCARERCRVFTSHPNQQSFFVVRQRRNVSALVCRRRRVSANRSRPSVDVGFGVTGINSGIFCLPSKSSYVEQSEARSKYCRQRESKMQNRSTVFGETSPACVSILHLSPLDERFTPLLWSSVRQQQLLFVRY